MTTRRAMNQLWWKSKFMVTQLEMDGLSYECRSIVDKMIINFSRGNRNAVSTDLVMHHVDIRACVGSVPCFNKDVLWILIWITWNLSMLNRSDKFEEHHDEWSLHAIIHMSDLIESIATMSTSKCPRMAEESIALNCGKTPWFVSSACWRHKDFAIRFDEDTHYGIQTLYDVPWRLK